MAGVQGGLIPKGTINSADIKNPSVLQAQVHRDEAANGSGSYYGKLDDGTEELIGGPGVSTLPVVLQATAVNDINTASQVDVLATGMTLTPPAGNYLVWFSGSALITSEEVNTDEAYLSIYSGGVKVPSSEERFGALPASPGIVTTQLNFPFNCMAVVTVDGAQAIEGRWRVNDDSTATMHQRNLTAMRIA